VKQKLIRRLVRGAIVLASLVAVNLPSSAGAQADTATTSFDVNGLKVILRRNTANDVIAANMYLLGGTQQLTPATQGIEAFLLQASERGTKQFPGAATRALITRLGTQFEMRPEEDWTLFGFKSVRATFDSSFIVFADRLLAPTLDSNEVELVRRRLMTNARDVRLAPDPLVNILADSLEYVGHPYGFSPTGNESSLFSLSLQQLRNYEASQMVTSRMLLVVVGNIDRAGLEPLVQRLFGSAPVGSYVWAPPHPPGKLGRALLARPASLPTNYILGYYPGPAARDPDYQALRIANAVLNGRFFTEIRSRRNLSYEVDAPFIERALSTGGVYVTTVDPNQTLRIMRTEITRLQTELIDPQGLDRLVQQFITDFFLKNETNGDQATFLARAQIYQGDYRSAGRFVDELRKVRPEDVRRVARTYMHDFRFVFLGKPESLDRSILEQF
jgi:zinc protease